MNVTNVIGGFIFFNVFSVIGKNEIELPFVLFVLLIGYFVLFFRLRFIQFVRLRECFKYSFFKKDVLKKEDASSLKVLFTSVASCTGMNAIAGMVFMVCIGGPGTVFWMPILAFFCMSFRFAEVYLSHSYRSLHGGEMLGGPFDYIKKGLADLNFPKLGRFLAFIYAFIMVCCGVSGVAIYESNQCVSAIAGSFTYMSDKRFIIATIVAILVAYIVLGGTKRLIKFMSVILPFIAIIYFFISFIVIAVNYSKIGEAIILIFNDAIHPKAIAGGFIASICVCIRKTALAHETGLGTSGIVHSSSSEKDSIREATSAMMTPLINCFFVSLMTALVLIVTGFYKKDFAGGGVTTVFKAFGSVNALLPYIITMLVPMLAFNVLTGWSNYIVKCGRYCFNNEKVVKVLIAIFLCMVFVGGNIDDFVLVMNLVDSLVTSIILINVPVVIALSGKVWNVVKDYKFK